MNRELGYYWVKAKQDAESQGDFDCLMGLSTPNDWAPAKWNGNSFELGHYDMGEHLFEINENRIFSPNEESPINPVKLEQAEEQGRRKLIHLSNPNLGEPYKPFE